MKKIISFTILSLLVSACYDKEPNKKDPNSFSRKLLNAEVQELDVAIDDEGVHIAAKINCENCWKSPTSSKERTIGAGTVSDIIARTSIKDGRFLNNIDVPIQSARSENLTLFGVLGSPFNFLLFSRDLSLELLSEETDSSGERKFKGSAYILTKEEGGRHTPFHNRLAAMTPVSDDVVRVATILFEGVNQKEGEVVLADIDRDGNSDFIGKVPVRLNQIHGYEIKNLRAKMDVSNETTVFAFSNQDSESTTLINFEAGRNEVGFNSLSVPGRPIDVWTNGKNSKVATKLADCVAAVYDEKGNKEWSKQTEIGSCTAMKIQPDGSVLVVNIKNNKDRPGITINTTHVEYETATILNSQVYENYYINENSKCIVDTYGGHGSHGGQGMSKEKEIHLTFISKACDSSKTKMVGSSNDCVGLDNNADGVADLLLHHLVMNADATTKKIYVGHVTIVK